MDIFEIHVELYFVNNVLTPVFETLTYYFQTSQY